MATFEITGTKTERSYVMDDDTMYAHGSFTTEDGVLMTLGGHVYESSGLHAYVGMFGGERKDGAMVYEVSVSDKTKEQQVRDVASEIEGYINNQNI